MTPQEKLKEIEARDVIGLDNLFWDDMRWLIARVRKLEAALEKIGTALPVHPLCMVAREALAGEGE